MTVTSTDAFLLSSIEQIQIIQPKAMQFVDGACAPYSLPSILEDRFSFEASSESDRCIVATGADFIAVGSGNALIIARIESGEIICELEFNASLTSISWDLNEKCAVVADSEGNLHLVTREGVVVFSKKISADNLISGLKFLRGNNGSDGQTLVAVKDNGQLIIIGNMKTEDICATTGSNKGDLPGLLQQLQIQKGSIPVGGNISRCFVQPSSETTGANVYYIDNKSCLFTAHIADLTAPGELIPRQLCSHVDSYTTSKLSSTTDGVLAFTLGGNRVSVCDSQSGDIIATYWCTEPCQQISLLATEQLSHSEATVWLLMVAAQAERANSGHVLVVMRTGEGCTILPLCTGPLPQGKLTFGMCGGETGVVHCLAVEGDSGKGLRMSVDVQEMWSKVRGALSSGSSHSSAKDSVIHIFVSLVCNTLSAKGSSALESNKFEDLLGHFSSMTTGTEVMFLLALVLDAPEPPLGFITKALAAAEAAIERLSLKLGATAKQRYLLEILRFHHLLETAEIIVANLPTDAEELGEEELRRCLRKLQPGSIGNTLKNFLATGRAKDALVVTQRCVRGALPLEPVDMVGIIPANCCTDDVVAWVKQGIVPRMPAPSAADKNTVSAVVVISSSLLNRAKLLEETTGSPFEAMKCVAVAKELAASLPCSANAATAATAALITEVENLHRHLSLQHALWIHWQDKIRLEEVVDLGLKGIIFDRIDNIEETELCADILTRISPIAVQFGANLDSLLREWVVETISRKIVLASAGDDLGADSAGIEDDGSCTLSRLVLAASTITDRSVQAMVVLTLLQMPVLEEISLQNAAGVVAGDGKTKPNSGGSQAASTRMLCELAAQAIDVVDGATREALTEATKLLKIKALAADYGIENFDPRNSKQVRSVVVIIASSLHRQNAVRDAAEFSANWGSSSVDMTAVLTRAVVQRCTNASLFTMHSSKFEDGLKESLSQLPEQLVRIVLDDALTYLLGDLEDISEEIEFDPSRTSRSHGSESSSEEKVRAEMDVRAALVLTAHYLDITRTELDIVNAVADPECDSRIGALAGASTGATVADSEKHVRFFEKKDDWITSELFSKLRRMSTLQTSHGVYLSTADLENEEVCQSIASQLAKYRVQLLLAEIPATGAGCDTAVNAKESQLTSENSPLDAHSRKACALLNVCPTYFTHTAMKLLVEASRTELAMEVAKSLSREKVLHSTSLVQLLVNAQESGLGGVGGAGSSVESDTEAEREAELLLDAAITLCTIAAKKANQVKADDYSILPSLSLVSGSEEAQVPEHLSFPIASFSLSRELLRCSIASCPSLHLGRTLDLLSGAETVLAVYERVEGAPEATGAEEKHDLGFVLSEGVFARDGILMQASAVAMPLMKFAFGEMKRRSLHSSLEHLHRGTARSRKANSSGVDNSAPDLQDLVRVLQRSENHLLATRVLYSSWFVHVNKAQALDASLLALCRKVLIYRDIDIPFSVACLAALSHNTMVNELRAAVPSIQSDFSRLQTVAMVGEELSHLWDDEQLLLLFQGLQANAKWWHILSSLGVKVDFRVLQKEGKERGKTIRALIPQLFQRGNMDLEMVTEYCRHFDLEPECAALTYIELLLAAPPTSPSDFSWAAKVRSAAERVHEGSLLQRLRDVLSSINPLDYEKVRYVCTWVIDLLSAEEVPEDSFTAEDQDITTSSASSLRKPQQVSAAVLQANRGGSHELDTYKRYLDIVGYLSGLKFPRSATIAIHTTPGTSPSPYKNVSTIYLERIPFWQLLEHPWSVLDPLLTQMPESAAKLAPLCVPLRLDKSDFNFRKIIALYMRMNTKLAVSAGPRSASNVEGKKAAMNAAAEAIDASMVSPLQQAELWRHIYEHEAQDGDDENALAALEAALAVSQAHPSLLVSQTSLVPVEGASKEVSLLTYFTDEMRSLKCRYTIRSFAACIPESPKACDALYSSIGNPSALIRLMLDAIVAVCWDLHIRGLDQLGVPITTKLLSQHTPSNAVLEFVSKASTAVDEIAQHCGLDRTEGSCSTVAANGGNVQPTPLELLRHNLIGRMLSDVDTSSTERDGAGSQGASSTLSSAGAGKKLWGGAAETTYNPSAAEKRRREDMYLSLAIAALVLSSKAVQQRLIYATQLDSVLRGRGVRVMRRLTARSKFRAAQALSYLHSALPVGPETDVVELDLFTSYLYCLCELQEIRLPCSEDSLLDAMGLKITDGRISSVSQNTSNNESDGMAGKSNNGCGFSSADPRALVRTWIHDEGAHVEVVELARDLLVGTGYQEVGIWHQLLGHMVQREMHRSMYETLLQIHSYAVFSDLSFGMMGAEMLNCIAKVNSEAVDRAEQVLQLSIHRASDGEWLYLSTMDTAAPSAIGSGGTSDGSAGSSGSAGTSSSKPNEMSNNNNSSVPNGLRVVLSGRLAASPGDWEEGSPEDLIPTLRHSAALCVMVLHSVSSRVKSRCRASLALIQATVAKACTCAGQDTSITNTNSRSVSAAVIDALHASVVSLITPSVFTLGTQNDATIMAASLYAVVVSATNADRSCCNRVIPSCLAAVEDRFDADVSSAFLDLYLINDGRLSKPNLRNLLENSASRGALLAATAKCLQKRMKESEDAEAVNAAVAELTGERRRQLMGQLAKLGKGAAAMMSGLG